MLTLRAGDAVVGIEPAAGGRLASLVVGGRERLVRQPSPDDLTLGWGCYLMAPWPGRLAAAAFEWQRRVIRLPRTHGRNAIHGLVWDRPWTVERATAQAATLACPLPPEWPFGGTVRQAITLSESSLRLEASITAQHAMPAALGWHPWFARHGQPMSLRVQADAALETNQMLPTGRVLPVAGSADLRPGPVLGSRRLDLAYVGARSPATLAWPDLSLTIAFEPSPASVVVYTPPHAVCVEPQTAPPNALRLPEPAARAAGVRFLGAGETLTATLELGWSTTIG